MRKSVKRGLTRVIISVIYIIWGIGTTFSAIKSLLALDLALSLVSIVTTAVGVLMLIAGFFGLLGVRRAKVRTFGVIIFVVALISIVSALPEINFTTIIAAVLAWLYILAVN